MAKDLFISLLKDNGLKVTKARVGILEILSQQEQPSDVQEVFTKLKRKRISADQATVYRVLEKFLELDIIKSVNFGEGKTRYEMSGEHHHHLVCDNCKKVEPLHDCSVDVLGEKVRHTHGFEVKRHALEFFGLCRDCK